MSRVGHFGAPLRHRDAEQDRDEEHDDDGQDDQADGQLAEAALQGLAGRRRRCFDQIWGGDKWFRGFCRLIWKKLAAFPQNQ